MIQIAQEVWRDGTRVKELKRLQKETERLWKTLPDLALDKLTLTEAARGNFWASPAAGPESITCAAR